MIKISIFLVVLVLVLIIYVDNSILLFFIMVYCFEFLSLSRTNSSFWGSSGILSSIIRYIGLRCSPRNSSIFSYILCICLLLLKRNWWVYLLSIKVLNVFLIVLNLIFCELLYLIYCGSIHNLPWYWCFTLTSFFCVNEILVVWRIDHLYVAHFHSFIVSLPILIVCLLSFIRDETH